MVMSVGIFVPYRAQMENSRLLLQLDQVGSVEPRLHRSMPQVEPE
jgi:hypothetical protein